MPISSSLPSEELPLASETRPRLASYAKVSRVSPLFLARNLRLYPESCMRSNQPQREGASYDYEAAFMFLFSLSLSLSLPPSILSRSILLFSASTSAVAAAVVFGRSRKDDGLMRNLEVSRLTGNLLRLEIL